MAAHGEERIDDWYWMANRDDPEVIAYLEAENAYAAAALDGTAKLQEALFEEIKARVVETDATAPSPHGTWWYWTRTAEGAQYRSYCRLADPTRSCEAAELAAAAPLPVRYRHEPRPGVARARNAGVAASRGDFIAFLDDDEEADQHWLAGLAVGFGRGSAIGCVTGMVLPARLDTPAQEWFEELGGHCKGRGFRPAIFSQDGPQSPLFPMPCFGAGANMAFCRSVLTDIGGFDVALGAGTPALAGEDTLALTLVLLSGYCIAYEPAALTRHHHRSDGDGLRRQLEGYGAGLTAYYAALLRHRPGVLFGLLHLFPSALAHVRREGKGGVPAGLTGGQRRRMLAGPVRYLRSLRTQARAARSTGQTR